MTIDRMQKFFGVGPIGTVISLVLFIIAAWVDRSLGNPRILSHVIVLKVSGSVLIVIGLGLHLWSMWALRKWWHENGLCARGPFRWFRHPLYAAWVTFVFPGIGFYMNSWIFLFSAIIIHLVWHALVRKEEDIMLAAFGDKYKFYAARTGRFIPKIH